MFVQCSVCGGVVGVQEEHSQNSKKNPERVELMREPAHSPFKTQAIVPSDINTVLKLLYG
jgi:hypothetical protein